jgi:hypothetical protein
MLIVAHKTFNLTTTPLARTGGVTILKYNTLQQGKADIIKKITVMSAKEELSKVESEEKSEELITHFGNIDENKEEDEDKDDDDEVNDDNTTKGKGNKDNKREAAKASKRPKRKVIPKKMKNEQQQQQNNNNDNNNTAVHACPNCNKSFKTKSGMKYHIDRKVCQKVNQKIQKDQHPSDSSETKKKEKESVENDSGNNRRSTRQKTTKPIKYDDDDIDDFVGNVYSGSSVDIREDGDDDGDNDEDQDQDDSHGKKGRQSKRQKREEKNETMKCSHCGKILKTKKGLQYHIDNYVCRIEKCTDPKIIAASKSTPNRKRNTEPSTEPIIKRQNRGALHDR